MKFKNVVVVRFFLIVFALRITPGTSIWLETFIILTLDIKVRKLKSNMVNQVISMFVK